jgi:hypothetical protein
MGMATGNALAGNMGSSSTKHNCVVGPVFNRASTLERLCKRLGVASLLTHPVARCIDHQVLFRHIDVARLPGSSMKLVVTTLVALKKHSDTEEWMYAMQQADDGDANAAHNAIFDAYAAGDLTEAVVLLEKLSVKSPNDPAVRKLKKILKTPGVSSYSISRVDSGSIK